MNRRLILIPFLLSLSGLVGLAQEAPIPHLNLQPYTLRTYDGKEHAAELGKLSVRENRQQNSGHFIELAFVRLRSTSLHPSAPIVFLAGGPGIPGIGLAQVPVYFSLFERLRAVGDVILLDQRGTGLSSPNLQCPAPTLPSDTFESAAKFSAAFAKLVRGCAEHWRSEGVDLAAYNSNASADDLEDLRRGLGAERLSLLSWSYGTELALAFVRRHGARVERVVLAGTRGPDDLLSLPSAWDAQIRRLSVLAAADPRVERVVPDLESLIRRVMERLDRNPVAVTVTDARSKSQVTIQVGRIGLEMMIRSDLSNGRLFPALPALFYTIDQGDYSILTRRMEQLYNGFGSSAMAMAVDCSAGWSATRLARVRREARTAIMRDINLQWSPDICRLSGAADLGTGFRSRIFSRAPALFIGGTLDPNTPAFEAEEVRRGFPNSAGMIIENGSHESLPAADVQSVIVDFFRGQSVANRRISFPRPAFLSVEEAKAATPARR